jgi:hypothetical protein
LKLLSCGTLFLVIPNTFYYHRYSHESLFTRESKKENQEIEISNKFINHILDRLDKKTQEYIKENPDWFSKLNQIPLILKNSKTGQNGKIVYMSKIKNLVYKIKNLINEKTY